MAIYAQVENNIVVNMVVADAEWVAQQSGEWILSTDENRSAIGCDVVDGVCIIPPPPPSVLPE
jgi:hypothetical protein